MNRIVSKTLLSEKVAKLVVGASSIVKSRCAGYFTIVRVTDHDERIPCTIADVGVDAGTITLIVQAVGESSQRLVALNAGDMIYDIVGPPRRVARAENFGTVACAGGGVGIAPLYPIARALKAAGDKAIVVAVARTKELIIPKREFREFADEVIIMTDNDSYGTKELATDGVESAIKRRKADLCVTIGPVIIMKSVALLTKKYNIPTISSFNTIMVGGTGMCGACRITAGGRTHLVCVDGPEPDVCQVDFDELLMYLNTYRK